MKCVFLKLLVTKSSRPPDMARVTTNGISKNAIGVNSIPRTIQSIISLKWNIAFACLIDSKVFILRGFSYDIRQSNSLRHEICYTLYFSKLRLP